MVSKKGQIAVWVIVALIVIVSIMILFVFQKRIVLEKQDQFSPENYMQECIRENIDAAVNQILPQGGFIEPKNYMLYKGQKVEFLCFNPGYFQPCVMQHPVYFNELQKEINDYVQPKVSSCYDSLQHELEKRKATIVYGPLTVNSSIAPEKIIMIVNRSATLTRENTVENFDSFSVETRSKLYELAGVAIEIGNQETRYCYFDYLGYMLLYPEIEIDKDVLSEDAKIYSITNRQTEERLDIAIRGCSIPPGL